MAKFLAELLIEASSSGAQWARSAKNVKKPQINVIVIDMSIWVMIE